MSRTENDQHPVTQAQKESDDWNPLWQKFEETDPEFLEAYLALRSVPFQNGPLPRKYKELIMIAVNASTTHMFASGVRRHITNALHAGATNAEIVETVQLASLIGIHACNVAVPILLEEIKQHGADPTSSS